MLTLLTGENSFEIESALDSIKRDFDGRAEVINAEDLNISDLPNILMGVNLFAEKRLIIIRGLSGNKSIWPVFGDWLDKISDDIHLVLIESKLDKRTVTYKALKSSAVIKDFPALTERDGYKIETWLIEKASNMSLTMNKKSIQFLVSRVGIDQWQLSSALEKLHLYGGEINDEIINELIPATPSESVFGLFESAINGNTKLMKNILDTLEQTEDVYQLSGLIYSQGFQFATISTSKPEDNPAKDFGIHPYVLQKMQPLVKKFGHEKIAKMVDFLAIADRELKSSGSEPWLIFEKALYNIAAL
jgi:DNA polymerase III delta subunit